MKSDQQLRQEISDRRKILRERKRKSLGLPKARDGRGCRDRNEEAKKRLGYTNPRSYVRWDDSEVLYGADWRKRKEELAERSGGRCEYIDNIGGAARCSSPARDPHHMVRRSIRRDDRLNRLVHLCGPHHNALDPRKPCWSKRVDELRNQWDPGDTPDVR